jgi:hypothetical protein
MFPATSDASWTRILHTEKLGGYEYEFYDADQDEVEHKGLMGVALHVIPNFADSLNLGANYLKSWDLYANGYLHDVGAYHDTAFNLNESIGNIFFTLDGRAETDTVFSAYMIEFDVLGHMQTFDDITRELVYLGRRIESFRARHSERRFHFTIFSDHGMDFLPVARDHLVKLHELMPQVGVEPVEHLAEGRAMRTRSPERLYAIPIEHTRVTYVALHTDPEIAPEVARRLATLSSIDMSVSRDRAPGDAPPGRKIEWFSLFAEGKLAARFGFDPAVDHYLLPADSDLARLDLAPLPSSGTAYVELTDEEAFAAAKNRRYPDLLFRARTSLASIGAKYPADVFVSFRPGYVSLGFQLPGGKDDIATQAFHGSLEKLGSEGTLLTEERDIPDVVRSDTFLSLFPRMKAHLRRRGFELRDGDPNEGLKY